MVFYFVGLVAMVEYFFLSLLIAGYLFIQNFRCLIGARVHILESCLYDYAFARVCVVCTYSTRNPQVELCAKYPIYTESKIDGDRRREVHG